MKKTAHENRTAPCESKICGLSPRLIIGPAHSGKSSFAHQCMSFDRSAAVIGTAPTSSKDERKQFQHLKDERPQIWRQFDAADQLVSTLDQLDTSLDQILIDSINQWIAHMLQKLSGRYNTEQLIEVILKDASRLILKIERRAPHQDITIVTSELTAGIVPVNPSARLFRLICGRVNQQLASACSSVLLLTAGIPIKIK